MRIVFMGTPDFAARALAALIAARHDIACVYSQPPRPANRGKQMQKSAVHVLAEQHDIDVHTPVSLKTTEAQADFASLEADIAIVAAYGLLLPQVILDTPKHGCLNIHASLLPRWRGAAPIHRAIEAGDAETGICIMQMDAGLDTGPVLSRDAVPIGASDTTATLHDKLADMGALLVAKALANLATLRPANQLSHGITYAKKIDKAEARLDFTQSAVVLERRIRAFHPTPGTFLEINGERLKILHAQCVPHPHEDRIEGMADISDLLAPGEIIDHHFTISCGEMTALRPTLVQRAGKQPVTTEEFLRGFALPVGTIIPSPPILHRLAADASGKG
jgi:methionyl-tRNA formyltransferase